MTNEPKFISGDEALAKGLSHLHPADLEDNYEYLLCTKDDELEPFELDIHFFDPQDNPEGVWCLDEEYAGIVRGVKGYWYAREVTR